MVNKALTARAKCLPLMNKTRPTASADNSDRKRDVPLVPNCVSGAHHKFGPSHFLSQLQESRSDFEAATHGLPNNRDLGARNIPITLTGVLFFDFMHGQTGHGLPHPSQDSNRRDKVVELHPVLCNDVDGFREKAGKVTC
jgi:hypothetical protein